MAIAVGATGSVTSKVGGYDTDSEAQYAFTSVSAGNLLVLTVVAFRWAQAVPDTSAIVNAVTSASGATAWSLAARKQYQKTLTGHKIEISEWYLENAPAGTVTAALDFLGASEVMWRMSGSRYTSAATASALGPTNTNSGNVGDTALSSGSTGTLPQADMVVRATVAAAYGTTLDEGDTAWDERASVMSDGSSNYIGFDLQEIIVAATTAKSQTWTKNNDPTDQGWAAIITSYKGATVNKRIEITGIDTAVNGTTGWTVRHWLTDTDGSTFRKVTGITAEASGGKIFVTGSTVPNVADGTTVTCECDRPGASPVKGLVGVVVGTVRDY